NDSSTTLNSKPVSHAAQSVMTATQVAEKPKTKPRVYTGAKFSASDSCELPSNYGGTRLTLLVKDPFWIYAYWEISHDSLVSLKKSMSGDYADNCKMILRMYEVTLVDFNGENANSYFDIEITPYSNNWYVSLWNDSVSYIGEIGLRGPDGRFFAMVRSNCVHTPRAGYSPRKDQIWMKVAEGKSASPYARLFRMSAQKSAFAKNTAAEKKIVKDKKKLYLTESDVRNYYSKLSPFLKDLVSRRLGRLPRPKSGTRMFFLEGDTDEERERLLYFLPKGEFFKRITLGSSAELVLFGGASGKTQGGASELLQKKIEAHNFFFELETELIVYGRTEPDAEVWLGKKKIALRKDGTFTLRFSLPDGKIPLEFTAVSRDKKEKRKIDTYVERRTNR
ncbi:MAG: DUF4912 domain-containing protein, partial [Candidatus Omnitrophica bacterium]|nr:DUF4912 domain-containing protein [Candidatus Omnitrophota bacterium]